MTDPGDRLNKYLAFARGISRREADDLIAAGRVSIDGKIALLGARLEKNSQVTVDGKPLEQAPEYQYLLLNKPVGYVCSRKAQGDNPTVYDLLPSKYHVLKTVGRLDKDSSGLILLTNDGDFAHQMTHPSFHKTKVYEVSLNIDLRPLHRQMISDHGVQLEDGISKFELERIHDGDNKQWRITMSEGRNRQIRRTFTALGYTVTTLHRTHFGSYALGATKMGEYNITSRI